MNLKRHILLTAILMLNLSIAFSQVTLQNLRCEMLQNPLGIDVARPRLSWQIASTRNDVQQTAYHILVASSLAKLTENDADIWNSGKVNSAESLYNLYAGQTLKSKNKYYWKVKVYTSKGESSWSQPAFWLMGLLHYKDWEGRWIGFDRFFTGDNEAGARLSARYFRKEFSTTKTVASATAYLMGMHFIFKATDGRVARVSGAYTGPIQPAYRESEMSCVLRGTEGASQADYHELRYAVTTNTGEEKLITWGDAKLKHFFRFEGQSHHDLPGV